MQPKSSEKPMTGFLERQRPAGKEAVPVIEKRPVLDLLERIRKHAAWRYDDENAARAYGDLYALLSEHGRL